MPKILLQERESNTEQPPFHEKGRNYSLQKARMTFSREMFNFFRGQYFKNVKKLCYSTLLSSVEHILLSINYLFSFIIKSLF